MTDQHREREAQQEKQRSKIDRATLKHIGGARTENLIRHAATKGRAKTFLFRTLHQNEQGHQKANNYENHQQEVDADGEPVDRGKSHGAGIWGAP